MVVQLDNDIWFPDPTKGDDDGCIAIGGDLSVDRLILAYSNGIFPYYAFKKEDYGSWLKGEPPILWYCPMDRFVIMPSQIHISHSMRNLINSGKYSVSFNQDFAAVIGQCSSLRQDLSGAWLGPDMVKAYTEMHRNNLAHSVEVWDADQNLVGGLYGIMLGKTFFGESMFSLKPSASKLALITLAQFLEQNGGLMIDCQYETPHLLSMGGVHIPYSKYLEIIEQGLQ